MVVELKVDKKYFQGILDGEKNFEIRLADKNINERDILVLKEKVNGNLTGKELRKKVKFVLKTKDLNYFSDKDIDKYGFVVAGF